MSGTITTIDMAAPSKFTPVQRSPVPPPPPQGQGSGMPIIPVILVVLYVGYLGAAIIGPLFIDPLAEAVDGVLDPLIRVVIAGILFALFAAVIIYMTFFSAEEQEVRRPLPPPPGVRPKQQAGPSPPSKFKPVAPAGIGAPAKKPDPVKKEEEKPDPRSIERPKEGPTIIAYPLEVEGGIFGDTYIELSEMKVLKIRSMIIGPDQLA